MSGGIFVPFQTKAENTIDSYNCLVPQVDRITVAEPEVQISDSGDCLVPDIDYASASNEGSDGFMYDEPSVYIVRKGDSIGQIAQMFDVSVNTILWANDMKSGDKLAEGDVLIILPMNGIRYIVNKGDTLKIIAKKYNVEVPDIVAVNDVNIDSLLAIDQELIVPDAEITTPNAPSPAKTTPKSKTIAKKVPVKNLSGYFTNPVPGFSRISQRKIHANNGVDLAAPTGTPIVAAAAGKVIFSRVGYNGAYGNMIIIRHPNGAETLYAHQSRLVAHVGDQVSKGEVIGYVGSTGRSTGPHLHYEVHGGFKNNAASL